MTTQSEERVEEIVARCETFQYSLPRDEQRALIASWRERGETLNRMRAAYEGPQLTAQNAALKDKP